MPLFVLAPLVQVSISIVISSKAPGKGVAALPLVCPWMITAQVNRVQIYWILCI